MATIRKYLGKRGTTYQVEFRNPEGRKRSKTFPTYNVAREFKRKIEYEVQTDSYVDSADGKVTLAEYYAGFKARQLWEFSTIKNSDRAVAVCTFADLPLAKLRPTHVEQWVKEMAESLSSSTVRTYFARVHSVILAAIRDRHLVRDPLDNVPLPRLANEEMRIPTPEVVGQILDGSPDHYRALWAVCAFAGLRRGEAGALKVSDVRFLRRELRVDRQVQDRRDGVVPIKPPKYESNRTIFIPDDLVQLLSQHMADGVNGEYLFMGVHPGEPPTPSSMQHHWRQTIKVARVTGYRPHDLRHFFASGLIADGADVVAVQKQLGHKRPSITLDTYAHLWHTSEEVTRSAAGRLMQQSLSTDAVKWTESS